MFSLLVSFIIKIIIYDPHATQKASVLICIVVVIISYPYNLVCILFGIAIPTSSLNFIQLFFVLVIYNTIIQMILEHQFIIHTTSMHCTIMVNDLKN